MSGIPVGIAAFGLTPLSAATKGTAEPDRKYKVVVVGAHPDDPETACGGTMLLLSRQGHEVVSAYLTRGEAGIHGKSHEEAARIRTGEAMEACKIMGARAAFIGQIDGRCEITAGRYTEMYNFLKQENPDMVFTHWPIDGHRDHRICSILVYDAWLKMDRGFTLYYFEVDAGDQTQNFAPTDFVDIGPVLDEKHAACNCHVSQNMERIYREFHEPMEKFRGMLAKCKYAEAFVRHNQSPKGII